MNNAVETCFLFHSCRDQYSSMLYNTEHSTVTVQLVSGSVECGLCSMQCSVFRVHLVSSAGQLAECAA